MKTIPKLQSQKNIKTSQHRCTLY